ncbi:MAG: AAA family ATPase [Acidimicrobiia bacterium]|nr:AAA family ATPase [Acidimicrobiia bacterium]
MSVELYDPVANPYAPGAGTPPPALVGRDRVIEQAEIALRRLKSARSSQHLLVTGLRGVGKTVLLGKLSAVAEHVGYRVIRVEAMSGDDPILSFLRQARRIVEEFDGSAKVGRALKSIESVSLTIAGTGVAVERQVATPDREALADVVTDIARAAADEDLGIMVALDEAQTLDTHDLRRLIAGIHRCGQDGLPFYGVFAGLPNLVGEIARAATYAERMFTVSDLGPLTPDQVIEAIVAPAEEIGVGWSKPAAELIVDHSDGFPFFVQTWAYHTWNAATDDPMSAADVERAAPNARHALDSSFFAARIARIPASEVAYVRTLASLGPGPHRSGEVAAAAGKSTAQVAAFRDRLIGEGVIFAPRYGWVEFAIPHFDRYVERAFST